MSNKAFSEFIEQLQFLEALGSPEEPMREQAISQQTIYITIKNQTFIREVILEITDNLIAAKTVNEKIEYLNNLRHALAVQIKRSKKIHWEDILEKLRKLAEKRSIHYSTIPNWDTDSVTSCLNFQIRDEEGIEVYKEIYLYFKYLMILEADKVVQDNLADFNGLDITQVPIEDNIKDLKRIKWKGTMKQLAELFVQLEAKGFIDFDQPGQLRANVRSLSKLFDLSDVKKNKGDDSFESLYKLFNGKRPYKDLVGITGEELTQKKYSQIFTERTKKSFSGILNNHR